jgi:hypothetical protein
MALQPLRSLGSTVQVSALYRHHYAALVRAWRVCKYSFTYGFSLETGVHVYVTLLDNHCSQVYSSLLKVDTISDLFHCFESFFHTKHNSQFMDNSVENL